MKELNKYMWIAIVTVLIAIAVPFFKSYFLSLGDGSGLATFKSMSYFQIVQSGLFIIQNLAACFWLNHECKKYKDERLVWALFGLVIGFLAVAIYYLAKLVSKSEAILKGFQIKDS